MVALDAVARPEEDRLRTSSYRRSPRGTTLCPVLALSRSLYRPLTPPQKTTPQQRLQEAARGDEASVRKVHRRPYFVFAVALRRGGLQRQVDDFSCRQLLILQLDGITTDGFGRAFNHTTATESYQPVSFACNGAECRQYGGMPVGKFGPCNSGQ